MKPDSASSDRLASVLGPVLLAAVLAAYLFESWALQPHYDDSDVSYRYAGNLVAGRGLVYIPGERVEGFSNLQWTLLIAAGLGLGLAAKTAGPALGLVAGRLYEWDAEVFGYRRIR